MGLKFLVTGGLGHIGSKLIREYAKRSDIEMIRIFDNLSTQRYPSLFDLPKTHVKFEFIEGDITDAGKVAEVVKGIDVVLHFAAITDAREAMKIPEETEKINFIGTKNVLDASINSGVKKFLFPSTTSVYGDAEGNVDENYLDCHPEGPYAINKLKAEKLVLSSNGKNGIQTFVLRKGTIFGTSMGMRFHTAINKFAWLAALDKPLTVWDTAIDQKRPYLSLNDAIRAYEFVEKNGKPGELYNVLNKNYTVREVVETIKKIKNDVKVEIVKSPMSVATSFEVSCEKIKNLGFELKDNLENCIKETLKLFEAVKNDSGEEEKFLKYIQSKKLPELEKIMEVLSEKIYDFRKNNNSIVPLNVFKSCLAIGGISSVVELLIEVLENGRIIGYALKKREEHEADFHGQYHIPGTLARLDDSPDKIFSRIEKEISGTRKINYLGVPYYFGLNIFNEIERKVIRTGLLYVAKVDISEAKKFEGVWKILNGSEEGIVKNNKDIIRWVKELNPPKFAYFPARD